MRIDDEVDLRLAAFFVGFQRLVLLELPCIFDLFQCELHRIVEVSALLGGELGYVT